MSKFNSLYLIFILKLSRMIIYLNSLIFCKIDELLILYMKDWVPTISYHLVLRWGFIKGHNRISNRLTGRTVHIFPSTNNILSMEENSVHKKVGYCSTILYNIPVLQPKPLENTIKHTKFAVPTWDSNIKSPRIEFLHEC